jgi:hypothetical protein
MTICLSVKVAEGLVLAADSMATLIGTVSTPQGIQTHVLKTYTHANKLARFKRSPIGIMFWGAGAIGTRSLQSLIMEFEFCAAADGTNVRAAADELVAFLQGRYGAAYPGGKGPELGVYVGGYAAGRFFPEAYVSVFPDAVPLREIEPDSDGQPRFGVNWFGQERPLFRLMMGYDPLAIKELVKRGAPEALVQKWIADNAGSMPLVVEGMPIQDAIDLARFLAEVTIGWSRFAAGAPACGGDVDIAVITPTRFGWAARKQWPILGDDEQDGR